MIQKVIDTINSSDRFKGRIEHIEILEPEDAIYGEISNLNANIKEYLDSKEIKLYQHQVEAIELIREGKNVLITTPTASGKTLSFNIPIFEALNNDPNATALYIYPAKALENDQLKVLENLENELNIDIKPSIYDGDTPKDLRPGIRRLSRLVITNPQMLHRILSWHRQWARFYRNLKYIVIDEAHTYRGVYGSNTAFLIRRFLNICNYYGSNPQFILSSATLANPEEFSYKLIGKKFEIVSQDTSPHSKKYFVLYNPFTSIKSQTTTTETRNMFLLFIYENLQTLCFTISRKKAEIITRLAKKILKKAEKEEFYKITTYRAGLLPRERRIIEDGLKSGEIIGVTSTNALELGIDIGNLNAVIMSGYPGTLISTWQQAGRAGRSVDIEDESIVVLVAFPNPLDQYLMNNSEFIFNNTHEHAVIDLYNEKIVYSHLLCALYETPITTSKLKELFYVDENNLKPLIDKKLVKKGRDGWIYNGRGNPIFKVDLQQISTDNFVVLYKNDVLEHMDRQHAYSEAHPGAVLINQGETYVVTSFNLEEKIIHVKKIDTEHYTRSISESEIEIISEEKNRYIGKLKISYGDVKVNQRYVKFNQIIHEQSVHSENLNLPPIEYITKGLWFSFPDELKNIIENNFRERDVFSGSIHGAEHALISMLPLLVLCDRSDIGGFSTTLNPQTEAPTIFIYDAFQGGIGLTEKAFNLIEKLVEITKEMTEECKCINGCPSCIISYKCGNDNNPLHKNGTTHLLKSLQSIMKSKKIQEKYDYTEYEDTNNITGGSIGSESFIDVKSEMTKEQCNGVYKGFTDVLRENIDSYNGEYKQIIEYGPDLFNLLVDTLDEKRLSINSKMMIIAALGYFVSPNDVIPERIHGPEGYIDDIFLCTYVLKEIADDLSFKRLNELWNHNEELKVVLNECYSKSKEYLGGKTEDVLSFVSFNEENGRETDALDNYINQGESEKIEFKSTLRWDIKNNTYNNKLEIVIAKSIAGFLNAKGGILLIGVSDDGSIYGIENDCCSLKHRKNKDGFEQRLIQVIENYVGIDVFDLINISFTQKDNKNVCIIKINPSPEPIILTNKVDKIFYLRVGCTTKPLDIQEYHKYFTKHFQPK